MPETASKLEISAEVEFKVYNREGELIEKRKMPANLILGNLHKLLAIELYKDYNLTFLPVDTVYPSWIDTGGITRPGNRLRTRDNRSGSMVDNFNYADGAFNFTGLSSVRIGIGTGTLTPTLMDYALQSEVIGGVATVRNVIVLSDGRFKVTFGVTFTLTAATAITEAGLWFTLRVYDEAATGWAQRDVMLVRDVFSAINVPAGGTIAVEYSFTV